ncbi:MAG TPA: pyrroline-5-carboxylate reductase [Clostridia bacterium]
MAAVKIGFIGTGNIGSALIKGLSKNAGAGMFELYAYDINEMAAKELASLYPVRVMPSITALVKECDVVVTAVKPIYMKDVLYECVGSYNESTIFITVAVGLPVKFYKKILGDGIKIVRTMPNIPALIGEGMTVISFDESISEGEREMVKGIFKCVGKVEELDESLMSEVTAVTGSSPAFVYIFIEAMADAAVQSGIPRALSYRLAAQAVLGSAKMVQETGKHPGELKDMVCSPGGTTIEAVAMLERKGFRDAVITSMKECTRKAREIAKELG